MNAICLSVLRMVPGLALPALLVVSALILGGCNRAQSTDTPPAAPRIQAADPIEAGRYLVEIGGCNDCHTAGYPEANGAIPESEWLTGVPVGFRGPWGTTYPSNLRLFVQTVSEDAWVQIAHTRQALPPMPWPSLNHMSEEDLRALYQYIKSLGSKGERMPVAVGPDQEPTTPYFIFEPQHMDRLQTVTLDTASAPARLPDTEN